VATYIKFMALPSDWAAASGESPEMVLDHLCGWVIAGAFPPGTLVTPRGFKVEPLSVFEAFQAITNHGLVHLGNWSWRMDPSKALELLSDILVTDDSVVVFLRKN
jgi:hypothetical protein